MGSAAVGLPELPADDSLLSRRFGPEVGNYFSGSPLNRLSFLRTDHAFLAAAFAHPSTAFLLLENLNPLTSDPATLAFVGLADIVALTGEQPLGESEADLVRDFDSTEERPLIVFLGIDERNSEDEGGDGFVFGDYAGKPYFAVDVTPRGPLTSVAQSIINNVKARGLVFHAARMHVTLSPGEAAIYGQARALIDWNTRNPFCAGCGQRTLSVNAGTKRVCPPTDRRGTMAPSERPPCPTRQVAVTNLSFPRTDPTVIVAVCSLDGRKVLLGRQRRWPPRWYSTLAGFLEPGESVEEAVRREVWEESGVRVGRVVLHLSQPWPYPANLMLGAIAQVADDGPKDGRHGHPDTGEEKEPAKPNRHRRRPADEIHLGHDPELEDARWFTVEEVRNALLHGTSGIGELRPEGYPEDGLRLPPRTAIANRLLAAVVLDGFLIGRPDSPAGAAGIAESRI